MSLSEVDICNRALIHVHAPTITSLSQGTEEANQCQILYPLVRDEVLRAHFWNFAIKQATLSKLADTPAFDFNYKYALPSDYVRIYRLDNQGYRYKIKGGELHTDKDGVKIEYVAKITDTTKFDAMFSTAVSLKLGSELSYSIAGSADRAAQLLDDYKMYVKEAKRADGQEGTPDPLRADLFANSRHEYGSYPIDWTSS